MTARDVKYLLYTMIEFPTMLYFLWLKYTAVLYTLVARNRVKPSMPSIDKYLVAHDAMSESVHTPIGSNHFGIWSSNESLESGEYYRTARTMPAGICLSCEEFLWPSQAAAPRPRRPVIGFGLARYQGLSKRGPYCISMFTSHLITAIVFSLIVVAERHHRRHEGR